MVYEIQEKEKPYVGSEERVPHRPWGLLELMNDPARLDRSIVSRHEGTDHVVDSPDEIGSIWGYLPVNRPRDAMTGATTFEKPNGKSALEREADLFIETEGEYMPNIN
jgi:hypothetical protein